jgi:Tfp pilus assembly protein PilX
MVEFLRRDTDRPIVGSCGTFRVAKLRTGESGIALVMALGILVLLTILGTMLAAYTLSNSRSTSYSSGGTGALALAEAGVNDAASILATAGNDPTNASLLPSAGSPATQTDSNGTISGQLRLGHANDADSQDSTIDSTVTKSPIDLATWDSAAQPGPVHNCTTGSFPGGFDNDSALNHSRSAVDLLPSSKYSCVTSGGSTVGQISWTPGNPGALAVQGTIFFDGDINMSGSTNAVYSGRDTIYSSGTVTIAGSTKLCALWASGHCDWTNWNPDTTMLVLVAGSTSVAPDFSVSQSAMFQGGAYAATDYTQGNSVKTQGPIQATNITLSSSGQSGYPEETSVPYGAPGGAVVKPVSGSWGG